MKFYRCEHCGNIIDFMEDAGVPISCCGEKMQEIIPGTTDAAVEKHNSNGWRSSTSNGGVPRYYMGCNGNKERCSKGMAKAWRSPKSRVCVV